MEVSLLLPPKVTCHFCSRCCSYCYSCTHCYYKAPGYVCLHCVQQYCHAATRVVGGGGAAAAAVALLAIAGGMQHARLPAGDNILPLPSLFRATLPPLQVATHLLLIRAHEGSVGSDIVAQPLQRGAVGRLQSVGDDSGQPLQQHVTSHVTRHTSHVTRHTHAT